MIISPEIVNTSKLANYKRLGTTTALILDTLEGLLLIIRRSILGPYLILAGSTLYFVTNSYASLKSLILYY